MGAWSTRASRLADAYPPGLYLREELEARGWTQRQFAQVIGRPLQTVNQIIQGRKEITPQTALELSAALGTSAELWLNLETGYRLWLAGRKDGRRKVQAVVRRARALSKRSTKSQPSVEIRRKRSA